LNFTGLIRKSAEKKIIYSLHALDEMLDETEMISKDEVRDVIYNGAIIEDYLEDKRGHSCLISGVSRKNRPVHVVCAPKEEYLAIITTYIPSLEKWEEDFKARRKK